MAARWLQAQELSRWSWLLYDRLAVSIRCDFSVKAGWFTFVKSDSKWGGFFGATFFKNRGERSAARKTTISELPIARMLLWCRQLKPLSALNTVWFTLDLIGKNVLPFFGALEVALQVRILHYYFLLFIDYRSMYTSIDHWRIQLRARASALYKLIILKSLRLRLRSLICHLVDLISYKRALLHFKLDLFRKESATAGLMAVEINLEVSLLNLLLYGRFHRRRTSLRFPQVWLSSHASVSPYILLLCHPFHHFHSRAQSRLWISIDHLDFLLGSLDRVVSFGALMALSFRVLKNLSKVPRYGLLVPENLELFQLLWLSARVIWTIAYASLDDFVATEFSGEAPLDRWQERICLFRGSLNWGRHLSIYDSCCRWCIVRIISLS